MSLGSAEKVPSPNLPTFRGGRECRLRMKSYGLVRTAAIFSHEDSSPEDQRRFQSAYQLHKDSLLKLLYRISGDWSLAEDSVHHAFATLYAKRREYDLSQSLKNLLVTIALNYARMQHRNLARQSPG